MTEFWYQCRLRQGKAETVAWIEGRGAKVGNSVEFIPEKEFWEVVEVYQPGMVYDLLKEKQKADRGSLSSIKAIR